MERQRRLPGLEEHSRKRHATKAQLCPEGGYGSVPHLFQQRRDVPDGAFRLYIAYLDFLPGESQTWINPPVAQIRYMTNMSERAERRWKAWLDRHDFIERRQNEGRETWIAFVHPDEWRADIGKSAQPDESAVPAGADETPERDRAVLVEEYRIEQNAEVLRNEQLGMVPTRIPRLAATPGLTPLGLALMIQHVVKGPTDIGNLAGWVYDALVRWGMSGPTHRWGAKAVCDAINDGWLRKLEAWDFDAAGVEVKYNDQGLNIHHAGGVDTISLTRLRQLAGEPTRASERAATTKSRPETTG